MTYRSSIAIALLALAVTGGCSGDDGAGVPGGGPDAVASPDAQHLPDGGPLGPTCSPEGTVEAVAGAWEAETSADLVEQGLVRVQGASQGDVDVSSAERRELRLTRTAPPLYLDSEADVLDLAADDPVREGWEASDLPVPDWETEGLLVYWDLAPYTENRLFRDGDRLVLATLRLEPCLDAGRPADPPLEYPHRIARPVPRASTVEHRTGTRWYHLATFPVDPAFQRHPANPLIDRAGGNGVVVEADDGFHMWLDGYSGATGMVFHATSPDGVDWDLAWDDAHTCSFEGVHVLRHKRDPTVIRDGEGFVMWFTMAGETPQAATRIYRATSEDGLTWSAPQGVAGEAGRLGSPFVVRRDGTLHLFGHDLGSRSIAHATGEDGIHWSEPETILTTRDDPMAFDGECALQPSAVHDGARWLLTYTACYAPREAEDAWGQPVWYRMHVALATSKDGVAWEREGDLLLSQTRDEGHWESGNLGRPVLLLRGDDAWLYYTGVEGGEPSVGLAVAEDWVP
ncbi:MAG: hypothetical protein ACQEXJ_14110 [Myxococcota bacterium]